ncbi:MAG: hypothetical protein ACOCRK_03400 [bacterium]
MIWYKELYFNNIEDKKKNKYINKLNKGKNIKELFCLCITDKKNFQMEILSTRELKRQNKLSNNILIIGLAKGKMESFELTKSIVNDVYNKTNKIDIKNYFVNGDSNEQVC